MLPFRQKMDNEFIQNKLISKNSRWLYMVEWPENMKKGRLKKWKDIPAIIVLCPNTNPGIFFLLHVSGRTRPLNFGTTMIKVSK